MFHGAVSIRFYVFQPHWESLQIALPILKHFTELRNLKHFIWKTSCHWLDFFVTLRVSCVWELASAELLFSKGQYSKADNDGQRPSHIMLSASCKNLVPLQAWDFMLSLEFWQLMTFKATVWQSVKYSVNTKCGWIPSCPVAHAFHRCVRMDICLGVLRL